MESGLELGSGPVVRVRARSGLEVPATIAKSSTRMEPSGRAPGRAS